MSNPALNYVFEHSKAKGGARLTLLVIANHADADGFAYPGVDLLCKMTGGQKARIVSRQIKGLRLASEVLVYAKLGRGNRYVLPWFGDEALTRAQNRAVQDGYTQVTTPDPKGGTTPDPKGGTPLIESTPTPDPKGGTPLIERGDDPLFNPYNDPSDNHSDPNGSVSPAPDESSRSPLPNTDDQPPDEPAHKLPTPQQAMFEAVCKAWGYALDTLTPSRKKEIGGVASELVAAHAEPTALPGFKTWLDRKAKEEQWKGYSVNAMKKYWPDYAKTLAPAPPREVVNFGTFELTEQYRREANAKMAERLNTLPAATLAAIQASEERRKKS